jgi:hypothetical protein
MTLSCVHDEKDLFDDPAAIRMQKAITEYRELLVAPQNGWVADYYPEKNHSIGGYAMFMKFRTDGTVTVNCEIATHIPSNTADTSMFDVFAEQGPILAFSTYNRVMHYFSEPLGSSDVDGRSGDYEFVIMKVVSPDEIHLKGKKQGNKLVLRRNNSHNSDDYYAAVKAIENDVVKFGLFRLMLEDRVIDSLGVVQRTMVGDSIDVSFTYTPEGLRLYEPLDIDGRKMQNFKWNPEKGRYDCTDSGVNARFEGYFAPGFQLQYEDLLGEWEMKYHGRSTDKWSVETVTFEAKQKYRTFTLSCDKIFSFAGIELTYDLRRGTVSLISQNIPFTSGISNYIRVCAFDRNAGMLTSATGVIGLFGQWNNDEGGKRQIKFVDNKTWNAYIVNGILLRLYTDNTNNGNFSNNIGGTYFSDITLTKK